jgi:hypothetical protein
MLLVKVMMAMAVIAEKAAKGRDRGLYSEDIQERGERRSSILPPLTSQQFSPAASLGSLPGSFS